MNSKLSKLVKLKKRKNDFVTSALVHYQGAWFGNSKTEKPHISGVVVEKIIHSIPMIEVLSIAIPIGFAVVLVGLTVVLLHTVRTQQNPKHNSSKSRYKRVPVIHPKRNSSSPSIAPLPTPSLPAAPLPPLQTRLNCAETKRQRKDPDSPIKQNPPAPPAPLPPPPSTPRALTTEVQQWLNPQSPTPTPAISPAAASSPSSPPLPLQTRLNSSELRRQHKDPASPLKRNLPATPGSTSTPTPPKQSSPPEQLIYKPIPAGHSKQPDVFRPAYVPAHPLTPQLLALVHGDRPTASRLLTRCKQQHPGNSESWYYEKVIWDLKRDRH